MKKLTTLIFIVGTINLMAQNFEGTMKWKMTMEFSDPSMKAKMEEASKKMSDPANQQKMEELKKQMENPQMKAMMEKNPQMKAQMEQMMAASSNGGGGSMVPTGITVKMKNGNVISKMEGGMMDMEVLFLKAKAQSFRLDRKNKTYTPMTSATAAEKPNVKITKTSEVTKILNYNCTKYLVETTENGKPRSQVFWATKEIKDWDMKSMAQQRMGNNAMFFEEIDGVPLKIEAGSADGKMVMEVVEMAKGSLSDSEFIIPADFKELKDNIPVR